MPREPIADKARRYLTEGRVIVDLVTAKAVTASVRGDGAMHRTGWTPATGWWCTCPASQNHPAGDCSHRAALRLVTATDLAHHDRSPHASAP